MSDEVHEAMSQEDSKKAHLSFHEMHTVVTVIEAMATSCPLTYIDG